MIRTIRHRGLRRLFEREDARRLHAAHVARIAAILAALDMADALALLSQPTYRLHPLKGDLAGRWAVAVSRTWRIVFRIEGGEVFDVDLVDYHQEDGMSGNEGRVSYDAWLRRHPLHPGRHLYHGCLEAVEGVHDGLGVSAAARKLGVSRAALSRVLNGRAGVSAGMALKLEAAGWGPADMWMRLQADYDLARERNRIGQWPADPESATGEASAAA